MRGDALEHVPQVQMRIDVVQTAGADQTVQPGGGLPTRIGAGEQVIAPAQHERADRALGGVVIDLDAPVLQITGECRPAPERVLDRPRQRRLNR